MRVVGLTGGIGCGKSTVGAMLSSRGVPVVCADAVAREVVEPGTDGHAEVVSAFGRGVVAADGTLDRKELARMVFNDAERLRALNAIVHPRVAARSAQRLAELATSGHALALYEAALLVENGVHQSLAGLIVVTASSHVQLARVMARDGATEAEAAARVRAQLPLARKVAEATYVVDNSGSLERLAARVAALYAELAVAYGPLRIAPAT
jgi:dephospho-CoA kinase